MVARQRLMAAWFVTMLLLALVPATVPTAVAAPHSASFVSTDLNIKRGTSPDYVPYAKAVHGKILPGDRVQLYWNMTWSNSACTVAGQQPGTVTLTAQTADATVLGLQNNQAVTKVSGDGTSTPAVLRLELTVQTSTNASNEQENAVVTLAYRLQCQYDALPPALDYRDSPNFAVDTRPPTLVVKQPIWVQNSTDPLVRATVPVITPHHPLSTGTELRISIEAFDAAGIKDVAIDLSRIGGPATPVSISPPTGDARCLTFGTSCTAFFYNHTYVVPAGKTAAAGSSVSVHVNDTGGNRIDNDVWRFAVDSVAPTTGISTTNAQVIRYIDRIDATAGTFTGESYAQIRVAGVPATPNAIGPGGFASRANFSGAGGSPLLGSVPVTLYPVDAAGNVGTTAMLVTAADLETFSYGEPRGLAPTVAGTKFGFVHLNVSKIPTPAFDDVMARLELVGVGFFINGSGTGSTNAHFTPNIAGATPTVFKPNVMQNTSTGTYISFNGFNGRSFQDGEYRLNITINQTAPDGLTKLNVTYVNATFKVDGSGPDLSRDTNHYGSGPTTLSKSVHAGDGNPLQVAVNATEWRGNAITLKDSGLANVTLELVDLNERDVVRDASNNQARVDFTRANCAATLTECLAAYPDGNRAKSMFNLTQFQGWVNVTFPGLPVGNYKVRVLATDVAGNTAARVYGGSAADQYKVRPRLALLTESNLPIAHPSHLEVGVLAAHETATSPTGLNCAPLCPVKEVVLQVKKQGTADTTALEVATIQQAIRTKSQTQTIYTGSRLANGSLVSAASSVDYYLFTNATDNMRFVYPDNFDATTGVVQVRAIARVLVGSTTYESVTDWTTASSSLAPSMNIRQPPVDWWINTTQRVPFNATFEIKGQAFTPVVDIILNRTVAGVETTVSTVTPSHHSTAGQAQPPRFFNYTGNLTNAAGQAVLAPGEYKMVVNVYTDAARIKPFLTQERLFAVAPIPTVNFTGSLSTSNIYQGPAQYLVNRTFEIPVSVGHEAANVSGDSAFSFELEPSVRLPNAIARYAPGDGSGFDVSIRQPVIYNPLANRTNLRLQVTLPTAATDGQAFRLNVSVATDAQLTTGAPYAAYTGIGYADVRLDVSGPATGIDRLETNATGLRTDGKLRFEGFAADPGSGTREVQVRIVDLTNNRTMVFDGGQNRSEAGVTESWATSLLQKYSGSDYYRAVTLQNFSNQLRWYVNLSREKFDANGFVQTSGGVVQYYPELHKFDRNATYRVDVRAVDNLGHVSLVSSDTVQFDPQAPELDLTTGIVGPHVVNWHGSAGTSDVLTVYARDNNCLARVSLKGIAPSGAVVGPANFTPTTSPCQPYSGYVQWTLDLSDHPMMTNEITNGTSRYIYWFEAQDGAGRITEAPAFRRDFEMEVRDVTPAFIESVVAEPSLAATGSTSRVVAYVTENAGIDRVVLNVVRNGQVVMANKTLTPDPLRPVAANGTGFYIADTDDLGLQLEAGEYAFFVRAFDINSATTCGGALCRESGTILRVSDDAPPAVIPELPARGTQVINATPTFQFRVVHPDVDSQNITVSAGPDAGNLTRVTPTFAARMSGATRQGWDVTYAPAALTDAGNYTIRVVAKSSKTGFANTTTLSYRVDPIAPNATHEVTGAATFSNKTWATGATRIALNATDEDGGPVTLAYSVNRGAFTPYTGAISPLGPATADGEWRLDYTATDAAGNVRAGVVTLHVDRSGPVITVARHGDEVVLTVSDGSGVGVDATNVTASYAYGAASAFTLKKAELLTGNSYNVTLGGDANATGLKYWFQARDLLGNVGTRYNASTPHVIAAGEETVPQDLAPTVRITSPSQGASVRDALDLRWTAADPEGQTLTVTISIRDPAPGRVLVPAGDNSGSYRLNLTGEPAGSYTVVVAVSDGTQTALASVAFTLERGRVIEPVTTPPPTPPVNQALNFAVSITPVGKTVATATYTVQRDGATYATGQLRQSTQGTWAGQVTPSDAGSYRIIVAVTYTDGTAEAPAQIASFTIQGEPEPTPVAMPAGFLMLMVLGALTVALAAYGAFVRWK